MERKLPRNFVGKLGYTSRGCPLFLEILDNSFPFATGSCRKFNRAFRLNGKCFWFPKWFGRSTRDLKLLRPPVIASA